MLAAMSSSSEEEDSCPCADPLVGPLRTRLAPLLRRALDGQLTHAEAVELASGRLAEQALEDLRAARCSECFGHISFLQHCAYCFSFLPCALNVF